MLTSAPGSNLRTERGFTLLELMVVVALVAITTAVVAFAVPDPSATRLEREAARLSAILESARVLARSGAMTVVWIPQAKGPDADYQFIGMPSASLPSLKWDAREVKAEVVGGRSIVLGPEPVIGAQSVILRLEDRQIIVSTDGLSPFAVLTGESGEGGPDSAEGGRRAPAP
ncbi:MAG: prepilin-type N-terminal cleavage/methylation domain-containing protein [Burkholderiales bacterium]|nr:prepilin-type N-terminal cleavage/methylation domain-containing protein [Burkholderiales bacterium]